MKFMRVFAITLCFALSGLVCGAAHAADMLDNLLGHSEAITKALRAADDARTIYERTPRTSPDHGRMEQAWREREYQLEEARLRSLARETRRSEDELRALRRDGRSWEDICRHYNHRPDSLGLGKRKYNQYDRHDGPWRDHYRHDRHDGPRHDHHNEPPGKARGHYKGTKDGPPGHYKEKHKDKKWD